MRQFKKLLLLLVSAFMLASCGNATNSGSGGKGGCVTCNNDVANPTVLPTPQTDALQFAFEDTYADTDFSASTESTGVIAGKATLLSVTDGDTANFRTAKSNTYVKVRFLGINTPESTAKVQPWGVRASHWFKALAETATDWCLVNDVSTYGWKDNSGGRFLGFVWYKNSEGQWRLYNLECVEQGYSECQLFIESPGLGYLNAFTKAGEAAKACGYRVNGQKDPTFDYTSTVAEVTMYEIRNHYDEYGITEDSSGVQLRVKGLVIGMIGDSMIVRDLEKDPDQEEDDPLTDMYCYAGYSSSLASWVGVGDIVRFYCRAGTHSGSIQLTDLSIATRGAKAFEVLVDASEGDDYGEYAHDMSPVSIDLSSIADASSLTDYLGHFVETTVTVRNISVGDYNEDGTYVTTDEETYYNQSSSSPYSETIYAWLGNGDSHIVCNLRIDGYSYPKLSHNYFSVGKTYRIKAYLSSYFEKAQLQLLNNLAGYNYVSEVA